MEKISDNVNEFLTKCSEKVGNSEKNYFYCGRISEFENLSIESPIEQILYCALKTIQQINLIEDPRPSKIGEKSFFIGLDILPQRQIDKYRVDFLICYHANCTEKCLVVECDSQEWHERTEEERRCEKIRDRYLMRQDYKVFHYTGKEIIEKPLDIAIEILNEIIPYELEKE